MGGGPPDVSHRGKLPSNVDPDGKDHRGDALPLETPLDGEGGLVVKQLLEDIFVPEKCIALSGKVSVRNGEKSIIIEAVKEV